ncbi:hypothetical protein ACVWWI_002101 [Bradyrhizobium sp. USDA 3686]
MAQSEADIARPGGIGKYATDASATMVSKSFLQSPRTAPRRDMINIPRKKRR